METLSEWGYSAGSRIVRNWLEKYRFKSGSDGTAGLYALSRRDLQYWYHVEGLKGKQLINRYRVERNVCASAKGLEKWLQAPAQKLAVFENNEDIHSHACGEYVLQ